MCADSHAKSFERVFQNCADSDNTRRDSSRKVSAPSIIFISAVLTKCRVVGVRGARHSVFIRLAVRVFVGYENANRSARGLAVEHAREDLIRVSFSSCGVR